MIGSALGFGWEAYKLGDKNLRFFGSQMKRSIEARYNRREQSAERAGAL